MEDELFERGRRDTAGVYVPVLRPSDVIVFRRERAELKNTEEGNADGGEALNEALVGEVALGLVVTEGLEALTLTSSPK